MPGFEGQPNQRFSPQKDSSTKRTDGISFEQWRQDFFADAELRGVLENAEAVGDLVLRLFWEQGTAPSVEALLASERKPSVTEDANQ
jgi:hypothetical protein